MSNVTYSPEDDKLRLYVGRVPRDEYERLRDAGFVSTPKQSCDFVAVWTPGREDLAREYLDDDQDIGDEDYSPEERAADKAERFTEYRDKRADEAGASADAFDAGPAAFGHQNRHRAERQAARHDRKRTFAVSQWSKAEYWHERTASVIGHALHKSSPHVRRGRILTLEAEQRKHLKSLEESQARYDAWQKVATMAGADVLLPLNEDGFGLAANINPAQQLAYSLANHSGCSSHFDHPTCAAANAKCREIQNQYAWGFSPYDLLTKTEYIGLEFERLTPQAVAELYVAKYTNPSNPDTRSQRWSRHYELRLEYETTMLENEGGMAGEAEMEVGGWIRGSSRRPEGTWRQIHKINKSPATKRVTSVEVMGTHTGYTKESDYTKQETRPCLVLVKMDRLGEDAYKPPTDEERAAFATAKQEQKAKTPSIPTINPTDEDAQRFQTLLNNIAAESATSSSKEASTPRTINPMTQAKYSDWSKGDMVYIKTFSQFGSPFKIRLRHPGFYDYNAAESVIVLTDKSQKPLPIDWDAVTAKAKPAEIIATTASVAKPTGPIAQKQLAFA